MNKDEFIKQQYISLREEIKETKTRIFKTIGFGLTVAPGFYLVSQLQNQKFGFIILTIPFLVIVVGLIYLAESNSLMRCGRYIRLIIEYPFITDILGWETWLEKPDENFETRNVDKYLFWGFYFLSSLYFLGSTFLSTLYLYEECKPHGKILTWFVIITFIIIYLSMGILFLIYLFRNKKLSTKDETKNKPFLVRLLLFIMNKTFLARLMPFIGKIRKNS